jgi:CheY-like chemotaxis protein
MLTGEFTFVVVDDNEVHAYALGRILESRAYRVLVADCGSEALLVAKQEKPNLILLDVNLPDTDGYHVCRELKSSPDSRKQP